MPVSNDLQVGSIVQYWGGTNDPGFALGPLAAIVAYVGPEVENEPRGVNLAVFDREGQAHSRPNVKLYDDVTRVPAGAGYACWPEAPKPAATPKRAA